MKNFFATLLTIPSLDYRAVAFSTELFKIAGGDPISEGSIPAWADEDTDKLQTYDAPEIEASGLLGILLSMQLSGGSICLNNSPSAFENLISRLLDLNVHQDNGFVNVINYDHNLEAWTKSACTKKHFDELIDFLSDQKNLTKIKTLICISENDDGIIQPDKPLVFSLNRFYFARYYVDEMDVFSNIVRLKNSAPGKNNSFIPDLTDPDNMKQAAQVLDLLFKDETTESLAQTSKESVNWQRAAVGMSLLHQMSVITGGPGTGKTTTVSKLLAAFALLNRLHGGHHLHAAMAAPTGKAAARMRESMSSVFTDKLEMDILKAAETLGLSEKDSHDLAIEIRELLSGYTAEKASTLHALIGRYPGSRKAKNNSRNKIICDVLIVDEVSMVDVSMMADILNALPTSAVVVFLGDNDQLSSVAAGSILGDICSELEHNGGCDESDPLFFPKNECHMLAQLTGISEGNLRKGFLSRGIVKLIHSYRFGSDSSIGNFAHYVNSGNAKTAVSSAIDKAKADNAFVLYNPASHFIDKLNQIAFSQNDNSFAKYLNLVAENPVLDLKDSETLKDIFNRAQDFRILSPVHKGFFGEEYINKIINEKAFNIVKFKINKTQRNLIDDISLDWYPGKLFMVTKNSTEWSIKNGDIVIAAYDKNYPGSQRVWINGVSGSFFSLPYNLIPDLVTGFVLTIHKSQGSEFKHTVMIVPDNNMSETNNVLTKQLIYTGATRAKEKLTIFADEKKLIEAVNHKVTRGSGLPERLFRSISVKI